MKATRFLGWAVAVFAGLAAGYVAVWGVALRTPVWPHDWLRNTFLAKERIAAATPSPRWLILGGSSAWFGLRCDLIEAATGQRAVNLGTHAEVPLCVQFWQAEKLLRAGDTVLLAEELVQFRREKFTTFAATEVALMAPEYFWEASWRRRWGLLAAVPPARVLTGLVAWAGRATEAGRRKLVLPEADDLMANLHARWAGTYAGEVPGYYNYLELDERGDFARERKAAAHARDRYLLDEPPPGDGPRWDELREFAARMRARGVRCLFTWQPFERESGVDFAGTRAQANFAAIREWLTAAGWREVGPPEDAILGAEFFYDTAFHLTSEGARRRTERLVERLREGGMAQAAAVRR